MAIQRKIKRRAYPIEGGNGVTIGEAFEEFVAEKNAKNLSYSTMRSYNQSCGYFLQYNELTETSPISSITQHCIFRWINTMKNNGVKPTSINHYLRDVRTFLYWCMDDTRQYIENPFPVEMIKGQEEPLKMFTDKDIKKLLEKPREYDSFSTWRTWAICSWILATGNRSGTICEVKVGDVNFKRGEIALRHTKNKKAQNIPLSSSLKNILREYTKLWLSESDESSWLFPNIGDEQLTTNALRHSFAKYCKDRGIERTNIHGLRHNFARDWIRNGGNIYALQKILGHSTLDMTRRYVNLATEDIKEDYDSFSPLDVIKKSGKRTLELKRNDD